MPANTWVKVLPIVLPERAGVTGTVGLPAGLGSGCFDGDATPAAVLWSPDFGSDELASTGLGAVVLAGEPDGLLALALPVSIGLGDGTSTARKSIVACGRLGSDALTSEGLSAGLAG